MIMLYLPFLPKHQNSFMTENQDRLSDLSCLNTDNVHIQEITVTGNAKSGFTIHTSPMSETAFKSEEVDE